MGLEKLNPFRTKYYGGGAYEGRGYSAADAQSKGNKRKENAERMRALNEIKGCSKCVSEGDQYVLCRKHRKPKYVKAAAKGF